MIFCDVFVEKSQKNNKKQKKTLPSVLFHACQNDAESISCMLFIPNHSVFRKIIEQRVVDGFFVRNEGARFSRSPSGSAVPPQPNVDRFKESSRTRSPCPASSRAKRLQIIENHPSKSRCPVLGVRHGLYGETMARGGTISSFWRVNGHDGDWVSSLGGTNRHHPEKRFSYCLYSRILAYACAWRLCFSRINCFKPVVRGPTGWPFLCPARRSSAFHSPGFSEPSI